MIRTSKNMRENTLFTRNEFPTSGKFNIPLLKKQSVNTDTLSLIAYSNTKANDTSENTTKGVHFFVDDYRFNGIYNTPNRTLAKLSQYNFLLTPDFSTYADMPIWLQIENIAKNRWCGAYWQQEGLTVIPTISWSTAQSFEFCFDGVEKNSIVAIGMIGCKKAKLPFLRGYEEMQKRIDPQSIICFGTPFNEMQGNLIVVDYLFSRKAV